MNNNYCLKNTGKGISLYVCHGGVDQLWTIGNNGYFRSRVNFNKCIGLNDNSITNGNRLEIQDCDHNNTNQLWKYDTSGTIRSKRNSEICFQVKGTIARSNVPVVIGDCHNQLSQTWISSLPATVEPVPPSAFKSEIPSTKPTAKPIISPSESFTENPIAAPTIFPSLRGPSHIVPSKEVFYNVIRTAVNSNYCLKNTGKAVVLYICHEGVSELWTIDQDGYIHSRTNFNKCIGLKNNSTTNGNSIEIQDCDYSNSYQSWQYDENGKMRSRQNSEKCFQIKGTAAYSNVNVGIWDCQEQLNQTWLSSI